MPTLVITPGQLRLEDARRQLESPLAIALPPTAKAAIDASVEAVNAVIREDRTAYGINTGFGLLAHTRIDRHRLNDLQRSLVLSHATGVGEPLDDALVRLIMTLKVNSLARGFSGIRREVIEA